jgi:hypothetical protein
MKEIRVPPAAQIVVLLAFLGAIAAALAGQAPELKRYLKIERM